jgi:hypothetical protein
MAKVAFELMLQSAAACRQITPGREGQAAWQEFQNKLLAFYLFEHVDSHLGLSAHKRLSLREIVGRAAGLGSYLSVWATEGLGHYYADLALASATPPRGVLSNEEARDLPSETMVPLHAGMGLALAEWQLRGLDQGTLSTDNLAETLTGLCRSNARPEYSGAVYEALGLAARNLYPHRMAAIDRSLASAGDDLLAYFWHGAGRAAYFAPSNFLPLPATPSSGLLACMQEPPHDLGRHNATAGFAWAITLVNIRHPEVLVEFLKNNGARIGQDDAFANGVRSAMIVWKDCAPGNVHLQALQKYRPVQADTALATHWDRCVVQPCNQALAYHGLVKQRGKIGELFRYQPLAEIVDTK